MTPSERIFQLLAEKHIDQKDLAKYLGLSAQTMTDWKNGKSHSYHKYLQEISVFLETSMDYLSTGKKEPAPKNGDGLSPAKRQLLEAVDDLTDEQCEKLLGIVLEAKRLL